MKWVSGLVAACLIATPTADPRLVAIERFLHKYPGHVYARDFLEAADENKLDWRLLPAICVAESGCGLKARRNNMFGWKNGRHRFRNRRQGIWHVAAALGTAARYQGNTRHKLKVYNPRHHRRYSQRVLDLMAKLSDLRSQGQYVCTSASKKPR